MFATWRQLSACVGLVPRQHTTGGKPRLLGITKRGDKRLRTTFIHGARAVVRHACSKNDRLIRWIRRIQTSSGANVATVALAKSGAHRLGCPALRWVLPSRAGALSRDQPTEGFSVHSSCVGLFPVDDTTAHRAHRKPVRPLGSSRSRGRDEVGVRELHQGQRP